MGIIAAIKSLWITYYLDISINKYVTICKKYKGLQSSNQYSGNGKGNLPYTYTHPDVKQRVLLEYFLYY